MSQRREPENYYEILGVARTASRDEIRAAFRARAKALHPDKNRQSDTKAAFQRLQEAYAILGRPEQRSRYDLREPEVTVESPVRPAPPAPPPTPPRWRRYRWAGWAIPALGLPLLVYWAFSALTNTPASPPTGAAQLEKELEATMASHALSFTGLPPEPTSAEVIGRQNRKFTVSKADYKRLEPIYDRLVTESKSLFKRKEELEARKAGLEKEERTLAASNLTTFVEFRIKVDAFNREGAEFRRLFELHAADLEDYFKQVERAAERER